MRKKLFFGQKSSLKGEMFPKAMRNVGRSENMDDYLQSLGLWRKILPKDGASLYRAVAEQVFSTQALHEHVRKVCLGYIERNRATLVTRGAGPTEMKALSLLYRRDFVIFQHAGRPAVNLTNNGFSDKIYLCVSNGNHYDEIYPQSYIESAAIAQSILYELLYEKVFGIEQPVTVALDMIVSKPSTTSSKNGHGVTVNGVTNGGDDKNGIANGHSHGSPPPPSPDAVYRGAPFPYRVAKLLSPFTLRNVEYDVWLENKKDENSNEEQCGFQLIFTPGDKCQVTLDGHEDHLFNAHIQELKPDCEMAVLFVEELGVKKQVPLSKLIALPKVVNFDNSWKKRGKKKHCDCSRASVSNTIENGQGVKTRQVTSNQFPGRRIRINSAGHPIKSQFAESGAATHRSQQRQSVNGFQSRKDKSSSPRGWIRGRQRYNSEPGDSQPYPNGCENPLLDDTAVLTVSREHGDLNQAGTLYWDGEEYNGHCESNGGDHDVFYQMNDGCMQSPDGCCAMIPPHGVSSDMEPSGPIHPQSQVGIETLTVGSPPAVAHHLVMPQSSMVTAVPYYNVMIPVFDNYGGPVNTTVPPSVDPMGADLPMNDCPTMRYFYNLGVQYFRVSSFLQQQQQQHQQAAAAVVPYTAFPMNGAGVCVPSGPVVTTDIYIGDDGAPYVPCTTTALSPPTAGFFPASGPPAANYVHYVPAPMMPFQQAQV